MSALSTIRAAAPADVDVLLAFLGKKATFDRDCGAFAGEITTDAAAVERALFGAPRYAAALLAEADGTAIGFAWYYFRFSSFAGRPSVWLDDLYVDVAVRSRGTGARLMHQLAAQAIAADCTHLAWTADDRNLGGMRFYARLGATRLQQHEHSVTWRIEPAALHAATAS